MLEIEIGKVIHFQYPAINKLGVPVEYRWRHVLVTGIRYLDEEPLSLQAIIDRPLKRRGHLLITGIDRELGLERMFYTSAMRGQSPESLQLIVVDDDEQDSHEPVSREFLPTPADRQALLRTMADLTDVELPDGCRLAVRTVPAFR